MSDPVSVLDGARIEPRPGLVIADRGPVGQVTLRAPSLEAPELVAAVTAVAGVAPPARLSAAFADDTRGAVWMAPDELLLFVAYADAADVVGELDDLLADQRHFALDVSDARAVIRLTGGDAAETLAKGAPLDFAEAAFPVGHARRTHLGQVAAGIWRREPAVWEVVCFRSYGAHLFRWLEVTGAAGAEVGAL